MVGEARALLSTMEPPPSLVDLPDGLGAPYRDHLLHNGFNHSHEAHLHHQVGALAHAGHPMDIHAARRHDLGLGGSQVYEKPDAQLYQVGLKTV